MPDEVGISARWEVWKWVGDGLVHVMHKIGATGSQSYESTAVHRELTEEYIEAARWHERAPDVIVRSHRHRHISTQIATAFGEGIAFTTAAWQLKTPHTHQLPGARLAQPQIGGSIIRAGDEDPCFARHWTRRLARPRVE